MTLEQYQLSAIIKNFISFGNEIINRLYFLKISFLKQNSGDVVSERFVLLMRLRRKNRSKYRCWLQLTQIPLVTIYYTWLCPQQLQIRLFATNSMPFILKGENYYQTSNLLNIAFVLFYIFERSAGHENKILLPLAFSVNIFFIVCCEVVVFI